MLKRNQILILLCVVLLSSCATQKMYLTLDVLRPGRITFPKDVEHVLIVNNTVNQPENYGHLTALLSRTPQPLQVNSDSTDLYSLAGAVEEMAGIGFFESVTLLEESQNESNNFFQLTYMDSNTVSELCEEFDADAIVALNRFAVHDKISDYYLFETGEYLAALDANSMSNWSVHYPDKERFETVNLSDSLFWEQTSDVRQHSLEALPERSDAIIDLSIFAGRNTVSRLLPRWEKVDRYFYVNNNKTLKAGMDSIRYKNFDAAIRTWKLLLATDGKSATKGKLTKGLAAMNVAITYEIIGEMSQAVKFANVALEYVKKSFVLDYQLLYDFEFYQQAVIERKKELELLDEQM